MSEIWIFSARCWICTRTKQYDDTMHECINVEHRPTSKSSVSWTVHQDFFFGRNARNHMFNIWESSCVLEIEPLWSWRKHRCRKNQAYRSNTPMASKFQCTTYNPFCHFHALFAHFVRKNLWIFSRRICTSSLFKDKFGIIIRISIAYMFLPQNVLSWFLLRQHHFLFCAKLLKLL